MSPRSAHAVPTGHIVFLLALGGAAAWAGLTATAGPAATAPTPADTIEARRLFEENIDAIHNRARARHLATYLHSESLARNGPAGREHGYEEWSARRVSTRP